MFREMNYLTGLLVKDTRRDSRHVTSLSSAHPIFSSQMNSWGEICRLLLRLPCKLKKINKFIFTEVISITLIPPFILAAAHDYSEWYYFEGVISFCPQIQSRIQDIHKRQVCKLKGLFQIPNIMENNDVFIIEIPENKVNYFRPMQNKKQTSIQEKPY